MSKAIRFKSGDKYLQNTMFSCPGRDFVGSGTAMRDDFDPTNEAMMALVAEEEALSIDSWKQDLAIAFGLSPDAIEAETIIDWTGDPETLPYAEDADPTGNHVRLPVEKAAEPPTLIDILLSDKNLAPETKAAIKALKRRIG